jgi:hypothetical protein
MWLLKESNPLDHVASKNVDLIIILTTWLLYYGAYGSTSNLTYLVSGVVAYNWINPSLKRD